MKGALLKDEPLSHEEAWAEIEAKEQEPKFYTEDDYWNGNVESSDLISREDAMQVLCSYCSETFCICPDDGCFYGAEMAMLKALQSADRPKGGTVRAYKIVDQHSTSGDKVVYSADRPMGEWIEREDWNGDNYYDCSVCGESFVLCDGTPSMNLYHFCPNCGAYMKGGE